MVTTVLPKVAFLTDGRPVRIRVGGPEDRDELIEAFDHLSAESRYRRFFSAMPRLTDDLLDRLTDVDSWHHVAIAAERIEPSSVLPRGLGVARFVRSKTEPDVAEISVAVIDEVQNHGLGRVLLESLVEVARERGIRQLRASVLLDNTSMVGLLHKLAPDAIGHVEDGAWTYEIDVEESVRQARAAGGSSEAADGTGVPPR